jgi:hypothetical protein
LPFQEIPHILYKKARRKKMIIYSKRKNSLKPFFPYVNLALVIILIGAFVAFSSMPAQEQAPVFEQAQIVQTTTIDVSGEWIGTVTEDYGVENRYDYRVTLTQTGSSLRGTDYQDNSNDSIDVYAEQALIGSVNGTSIYFYEAQITVLEGVGVESWCRIEVRVDYEVVNGLETLIGTWDSAEEDRAGCTTISGRVMLTRQPE